MTLQQQVGEWSLNNFGPQISKVHGDPMHSFAPLLGILEEGLNEVSFSHTREEVIDGIGDICIYMCDFATREGDLDLEIVFYNYLRNDYSNWFPEELTHAMNFTIQELYGKLCHIVLKHHQGIRKYKDRAFYVEQRNLVLCRIIETIQNQHQVDFFATGQMIFNKVVSKRNWKKNPESGN